MCRKKYFGWATFCQSWKCPSSIYRERLQVLKKLLIISSRNSVWFLFKPKEEKSFLLVTNISRNGLLESWNHFSPQITPCKSVCIGRNTLPPPAVCQTWLLAWSFTSTAQHPSSSILLSQWIQQLQSLMVVRGLLSRAYSDSGLKDHSFSAQRTLGLSGTVPCSMQTSTLATVLSLAQRPVLIGSFWSHDHHWTNDWFWPSNGGDRSERWL